MERMLLINFVREENGLYALRKDRHTEEVREKLRNSYRAQVLEIGLLPNVYELIEEIRAYDMNHVGILVNPSNTRYVKDFSVILSTECADLKIHMYPTESLDREYDDSALWRGTRFFLTGLYPSAQRENMVTKHICMEDISEDLLKGIAGYVGMNHNLFVRGAGSMDFNRVSRTGYLASNATQIIREEGGSRLVMNGGESEKRFLFTGYAQYREPPDSAEMNTYVGIYRREDFDAFLADMREYARTGLVRQNRMWKPDMIDMCRFCNSSNCSVDSMQRLRVKRSGLYPCLTSDYCAGTAGEPFFRLSVRIKRDKSAAANHRDCVNCGSRGSCSKCIALPEFLSQEEFCKLMTDEMRFSYLYKSLLALKFIFNSRILRPEDDIRVVTPLNQKDLCQSKEFILDEDSFLMEKRAGEREYILFSIRKAKVFRVNENFFRLSEIAARGCDIEACARAFGYATEEERRSIQEAYRKVISKLQDLHMLGG